VVQSPSPIIRLNAYDNEQTANSDPVAGHTPDFLKHCVDLLYLITFGMAGGYLSSTIFLHVV